MSENIVADAGRTERGPMKFYRKPVVVVTAMQLRWDNWSEMCEHLGPAFFANGGTGAQEGEAIALDFPSASGMIRANEGDWIVRGEHGEVYPCKRSAFDAAYESAADLVSAPYVTCPLAASPVAP